ncbi:hypothetical protein L198_04662 [Cryptococcus wingfieldii CBS 7118]|uniref:Uncharacterized protein n=1 Tax=Cryptococcus wingfieldii CBS 7118 TaxID=1295528 RepID=A0A1E3J348_9TREE|nr:hypothetical protein L198_04662 [Cryptococcus wingfieldii CBS 7118]ODN95272.1 hypothetical protein L198_04662 [Cryptococcus wingfieldii CBS 7118]
MLVVPSMTLSPPSPTTHIDRVRHLLSFDRPVYPLPVPNLELHSAAASGNVGLVHYALTHGQPVNSVLHGVLPLHAACSGGSLSVVRMLIEQGADVNAPRLPRRYSDGKKGTAPSVGTAGSTPLHFAAANGHAPVVQMLLACGADPSKPDKNGHTALDLAELSNHDQVVNVLHAYQKVQNEDAATSGERSPAASSLALNDGESVVEHGKGKERERTFSFSSLRSNDSKPKKGLQALLSKASKSSLTSETPKERAPPPPRLHLPSEASALDKLASPFELDTPQTPSPMKGDNTPLYTDGSTGSWPSLPLSRQSSNRSATSQTSPGIASPIPRPPPARAQHSTSSRRPSLPSIFEKAVHPGAAFRAALRHESDHEEKKKKAAQQDSHHHHGFKRLFRRAHSPPSRSPSPPARNPEDRVISAEDLDAGMARLKRASLDMERPVWEDGAGMGKEPISAPATKSRFFEEELVPPSSSSSGSSGVLPNTLNPPPPSSVQSTPCTRPRTGNEVIAPSPLANEWAGDEEGRLKRAWEIVTRHSSASSLPTISSPTEPSPDLPTSPGSTKPRSYTMPGLSNPMTTATKSSTGSTSSRPTDDLRKLAAEGSIREMEKQSVKREMEGEEGDAEVEPEGEEWHDARSVLEAESTANLADSAISLNEGPVHTSSRPTSSHSLSHTRGSFKGGRIRSGSIGSVTTDVSRISSPPPSHIRMSSITDIAAADDSAEDDVPPLSKPPSLHGASRPRGKSLSSNSSGNSHSHTSGDHQPLSSTTSTSLTVPSLAPAAVLGHAPSSNSLASFPPVPEHAALSTTPSSPSLHRRLTHSRTISSRAEAKAAIQEGEDEILLLAQLEQDGESKKDLAAVLAAYGESHEIYAEMERKRGVKDKESAHRSRESSRDRPTALTTISAPDARSDIRLSNIYDKRAESYRERLASLTIPATGPLKAKPAPTSRTRQRQRQRAVSASANDMWLKPGSAGNRMRSASGGIPLQSNSSTSGIGSSGSSGAGWRDNSRPGSVLEREEALEQEDDRYPWISVPRPESVGVGVSQSAGRPRGLSNASTASHNVHNFILPAPAHTSKHRDTISSSPYTPHPRIPSSGGTTISISGNNPSPYASLFSHKFTGTPLNDDESEDEEAERQNYTVIENDWRGGRVVGADELGFGGMGPGGAGLGGAGAGDKKKWGLRKLGHHLHHHQK